MRCAPRSPSHTHARCPALHTTYRVPHTTCLIPRAPRPVHMPHTSHPVPRASYLISRTTQLVYTRRPGKGKVDNSIWIIGWGIKTLQVKYGSPVPPITGESILCIRHAFMYKARLILFVGVRISCRCRGYLQPPPASALAGGFSSTLLFT